jgi:hypothetical protein
MSNTSMPANFLNRTAFHHRFAGERPDVAEPEHGGAVRNHGDQVGARGKRRRLRRIGGDRFAGGGDAGRIGEREIVLSGKRLRRLDLELPRPRHLVIGERARAQIRGQVSRHKSLPGSGSRIKAQSRVDRNGAVPAGPDRHCEEPRLFAMTSSAMRSRAGD